MNKQFHKLRIFLRSKQGKWIVQGALIPIVIGLTIIFGGTVHSMFKIDGISLVDHVYNGWVWLTVLHFGALFLGISSGILIFYTLGETKYNWMFFGFMGPFIIIVTAIWSISAFEFRKEPKLVPENVITFELKWPFGKEDEF